MPKYSAIGYRRIKQFISQHTHTIALVIILAILAFHSAIKQGNIIALKTLSRVREYLFTAKLIFNCYLIFSIRNLCMSHSNQHHWLSRLAPILSYRLHSSRIKSMLRIVLLHNVPYLLASSLPLSLDYFTNIDDRIHYV